MSGVHVVIEDKEGRPGERQLQVLAQNEHDYRPRGYSTHITHEAINALATSADLYRQARELGVRDYAKATRMGMSLLVKALKAQNKQGENDG